MFNFNSGLAEQILIELKKLSDKYPTRLSEHDMYSELVRPIVGELIGMIEFEARSLNDNKPDSIDDGCTIYTKDMVVGQIYTGGWDSEFQKDKDGKVWWRRSNGTIAELKEEDIPYFAPFKLKTE